MVIYSPDMETLVWRMLSRKEVVWVYKLVYIATVYRSPCPSQKSDPSCISMIGVSMFASIDLCIRLKTRVEHKCPRRVISFFFLLRHPPRYSWSSPTKKEGQICTQEGKTHSHLRNEYFNCKCQIVWNKEQPSLTTKAVLSYSELPWPNKCLITTNLHVWLFILQLLFNYMVPENYKI